MNICRECYILSYGHDWIENYLDFKYKCFHYIFKAQDHIVDTYTLDLQRELCNFQRVFDKRQQEK